MVEYELGDGPEFSAASWLNVKHTLGLKYPNLPYLFDGDVKLTETIAIHRYLADRYRPELLGRTEKQRAEVSMLEGIICGSGLKNAITKPCYKNDRDEAVKVIEEQAPTIAAYLGHNRFLTGTDPVWLDFFFFELLELMVFLSFARVLRDNPKLVQYHKNVASLPGLKEYLKSKGCIDKMRPFNAKSAHVNTKPGENVDKQV